MTVSDTKKGLYGTMFRFPRTQSFQSVDFYPGGGLQMTIHQWYGRDSVWSLFRSSRTQIIESIELSLKYCLGNANFLVTWEETAQWLFGTLGKFKWVVTLHRWSCSGRTLHCDTVTDSCHGLLCASWLNTVTSQAILMIRLENGLVRKKNNTCFIYWSWYAGFIYICWKVVVL